MEKAENPLKSRHEFKTTSIMKQYQKAEVIAKNLPTGSYAAGCPANYRGPYMCTNCERTK